MSEPPRTERVMGRLLYRFAPPEQVKRTQAPYVRLFAEVGARRVLDVGCGRGIFLGLLREAGMEPVGVDGAEASVALCREQGFAEVERGEALGTLAQKAAAGERFDGIFCSHLVEHLAAEQAIALISRCAELLSPGGRLVLVTPNVANLQVWTQVFWLDPTHVRPYPRDLLEVFCEEAGLIVAASYDDPRSRPRYLGPAWYKLLPHLLRYGLNTLRGMDAIVVADRPR